MAASRPSFSAAFSRVLASLLAIVHTRLELAGLELEEEVARVLELVLLGAGLVLFGLLALLVGSLVVVFAFDGMRRLLAMGLLALVYALIAVALAWRLKALLAARPPLFAGTLAELARDRAALLKRSAPGDLEATP